MTLIKSISGIRGTIGGRAGDNLTPVDIVQMTASFGQMIKDEADNGLLQIVIGRDARVSGEMVSALVSHTLAAQGFTILDAGLSTTPSIEMAVTATQSNAGIIITASHNPGQWNALKFLNHKGEFISAEAGKQLIHIAENNLYYFNDVDTLGKVVQIDNQIQNHIDKIFELELVDLALVKKRSFKIVVDCINSTGAISVGLMLEQMGCDVHLINEEMTGLFAHNPEPLAPHLTVLCEKVKALKADLGIAVDPDVDRLSFICPDGTLLGEENTLVALAKYILHKTPGATVSNLSSTRGLRDVTQEAGMTYFAAAVGEVNVVAKMKEVNAVIGGEGNGGVIYPPLHYGRDALVGIALMLTYLAEQNLDLNQLKKQLPQYAISKNKIELQSHWNIRQTIIDLIKHYSHEEVNTEDGLKIDFESGWVQLRQSNTEPIIRVYSEAPTIEKADALALDIINQFRALLVSA